MGRRVRNLSALAAGVLAFVVGTSTAHAFTDSRQIKCQKAIAKESLKFVQGQLKIRSKCIDANLKEAGSCLAPDSAALTKASDKLRAGLAKACSFITTGFPPADVDNLFQMGFPGACPDANPANGFTVTDLQDCIVSTHEDIVVNSILPLQYDSSIVAGPLTDKDQISCQKNLSKAPTKFLLSILKNLQKCRNGLLDCKVIDQVGTTECKLTGFQNTACATADPKTVTAISKAKTSAETTIKKCTDPATSALQACEPDQTTAPAAATCETQTHQLIVDDPDQSAAFDLLDIEYAKPPRCGDNRRNQRNEECDGTDDADCPGQCGSSTGFFSCLCLDIPRTRVVEHANSDLDNGWTGISHDSGIVEGGGYTSDLWDCDGPLGPDTVCTVGPSCSGAPHAPCSQPVGSVGLNNDSICAGLGQGTCRITEAGSQGPHCLINFKKRCALDSHCTTGMGADPLDRCVIVPHGAPLPLSSGGVSVCVVNQFKEDVTGTTNLATGDGAVRLHQNSITYLGPDQQQPCPVCGGFCSGPGGENGPGARTLCTTNADCTNPSTCVTDNVCNWGPNIDQPCRPTPPFGGPTTFFGSPSVDCPFPTSGNFLGNIDILFNPATTGTTTLTANIDCTTTGFTNKVCAGGGPGIEHRPCTTNAECGAGTCNEQCFCPSGAFVGTQRPNGCDPACLGGPNDANPCSDDSECPGGGFCHIADCRLNLSDTDSSQEGLCTVGPFDGVCSTHTFKTCEIDSDCADPECAFCDLGETCVQVQRNCFVNPTISRSGTPGTPDRVSAAIFCIQGTSSSPVNGTAGLPGPGAITQPATTIETGF